MESITMIDISTEAPIPFGQATSHVPSRKPGRRVHPSTLWRWSRHGIIGRDGSRVHLEVIQAGGTPCTSIEALQRFFARLTGEAHATVATTSAPSGKAHKRTEAALDAAGI